MSVAPRQLLDSAKLIRAHVTNEAGHRATISRAYYAGYHAARDFHSSLPSVGSLSVTSGLHEQLCERLQNPTIPTMDARHLRSRQIGAILRDFHRKRVIADYQVTEQVADTNADEALVLSERLLSLAA